MENQARHPHQLKPPDEEIVNLLKQIRNDEDTAIIETYMALHRHITGTLPEISYAIDLADGQMGYGAKQYGYDGWGMVALAHHKKRVNLHFIKGAQLSAFDHEGILEGKGKQLRHIKFSSPEEVVKVKEQIKALLLKAAALIG